MFSGVRQLCVGPPDGATMHLSYQFRMVADAEALYDAAQRDASLVSTTTLRLVSSDVQYSGGMAEPSARQAVADRAQHRVFKLVHDPEL